MCAEQLELKPIQVNIIEYFKSMAAENHKPSHCVLLHALQNKMQGFIAAGFSVSAHVM